MKGFTGKRRHVLKFELKELRKFQKFKGKLIVYWPAPDRGWTRWLNGNNEFSVRAIPEESKLIPSMPDWTEIVWPHSRLGNLPQSWQNRMSQWRGIYFISDNASKRGYVGSAYGEENILQRWRTHFRTGGDAKYLRKCNSEDLVFSILEIDSHVRSSEEIREKERSWKRRLHTLYPSGLNANL